MMMDRVFLILLFVILVLERKPILVVSGADENGGGDGDTTAGGVCGVNLAGFLPLPYSNLPNMVCKPVWNSYIIRVSLLIFFMHSSCVGIYYSSKFGIRILFQFAA